MLTAAASRKRPRDGDSKQRGAANANSALSSSDLESLVRLVEKRGLPLAEAAGILNRPVADCRAALANRTATKDTKRKSSGSGAAFSSSSSSTMTEAGGNNGMLKKALRSTTTVASVLAKQAVSSTNVNSSVRTTGVSFTLDDDVTLVEAVALHGSRWTIISDTALNKFTPQALSRRWNVLQPFLLQSSSTADIAELTLAEKLAPLHQSSCGAQELATRAVQGINACPPSAPANSLASYKGKHIMSSASPIPMKASPTLQMKTTQHQHPSLEQHEFPSRPVNEGENELTADDVVNTVFRFVAQHATTDPDPRFGDMEDSESCITTVLGGCARPGVASLGGRSPLEPKRGIDQSVAESVLSDASSGHRSGSAVSQPSTKAVSVLDGGSAWEFAFDDSPPISGSPLSSSTPQPEFKRRRVEQHSANGIGVCADGWQQSAPATPPARVAKPAIAETVTKSIQRDAAVPVDPGAAATNWLIEQQREANRSPTAELPSSRLPGHLVAGTDASAPLTSRSTACSQVTDRSEQQQQQENSQSASMIGRAATTTTFLLAYANVETLSALNNPTWNNVFEPQRCVMRAMFPRAMAMFSTIVPCMYVSSQNAKAQHREMMSQNPDPSMIVARHQNALQAETPRTFDEPRFSHDHIETEVAPCRPSAFDCLSTLNPLRLLATVARLDLRTWTIQPPPSRRAPELVAHYPADPAFPGINDTTLQGEAMRCRAALERPEALECVTQSPGDAPTGPPCRPSTLGASLCPLILFRTAYAKFKWKQEQASPSLPEAEPY